VSLDVVTGRELTIAGKLSVLVDDLFLNEDY
jgi:hypothetical protein